MGSAIDGSPDLTRASGSACPPQVAYPPLHLTSAATLPQCSLEGHHQIWKYCAWPTACLSTFAYLPLSPRTAWSIVSSPGVRPSLFSKFLFGKTHVAR